jgi:hypothetical protein
MCCALISEQKAIISLDNINLSVFVTEAESLLRRTNWVFKSDSYTFVQKRLTSLSKSWQAECHDELAACT